MNKKFLSISIIALVSFIILHVVFLEIDYHRIKNENKPIFAVKTAIYKDGGSVEYTGLGYKIISYHFFGEEEIDGKLVDGVTIGPGVEGIPGMDFFDQLIAPPDLKFVTYEELKSKN